MHRDTCHVSGRRLICVASVMFLLIAGSVIIPTNSAHSQQFTFQTVQVVDLSSTAADIQLLGAADDDHVSGNGAPGAFSVFPRARSLASGDLNNDGIADLVVGAPDVDFTPQGGAARPNSGAVYVLFGRLSFPGTTLIDTNPAAANRPDVTVFGANGNDSLGFAVAAGDVNGDGIDDLVIGAPGFDFTNAGPPPSPRDDAGAVYVLFGSTGFSAGTVDLSNADSASVQIVGAATGDLFGSSIAVGEVNGGNSSPDLFVGAPGSKGPPDGAPRDDGGAAYVLFGGPPLANPGATTKGIDLATDTAPVTIFGKAASQLGSALAIGDVNGGGAGDLLVGAPKANRPDLGGDVVETGAAFVVFGGNNLNANTFDITTTQQQVSIYGSVAGDHLGASIAAGDVTGGGPSDILIGAPDSGGPGNLRPFAGEAYVLAGGPGLNPPQGATQIRIDVSFGTAALTVIGAAAGDRLGSCLAAGAVNTVANTDAIPDLLVGAPGAAGNSGAVHVIYGGSELVKFFGRDMLLGQDDARITGAAAGDELGHAIATGDFDKNRGGDIAVGAPFASVPIVQSPARTDAGKVYVLLASPATVPPQNEDPSVTVVSPNGNETLAGGHAAQITWTASDPDGDGTIQNFQIALSTDSGANFNTVIASTVTGSARSIDWNVPTGLNSMTARVRITAFDNAGGSGQDSSDADFTISDAGVVVVLAAPNGGETLKWDQSFMISWVVGMGLEDQVKGFDLFYTTDGGASFASITPPNPTEPALASDVREFAWTVPRICRSAVRVVVRATSITSAVSSDTSNGDFSIFEQEPHIDTSNITFSNKKKLNFRLVPDSTPLFVEGVRIEISTDQTGAQLIEVDKVKVKGGGAKIQTTGKINGEKVGNFFPDGAIRFVRITNATCGINVMRLRRTGDSLVPDSSSALTSGRWQ